MDDWQPHLLPPHLRKLHRKQMDAIRDERDGNDGGWDEAEAEAARIERQQQESNMEES